MKRFIVVRVPLEGDDCCYDLVDTKTNHVIASNRHYSYPLEEIIELLEENEA